MHKMSHGYRGHGWGRGGFFLPGMLFFIFLLVVFGKFLWPLLFFFLLAGPFFFWMKRGAHRGAWSHGERHHWSGGHWGWDDASGKPKRKNDEFDDDKAKRKNDDNTLYV